MVDPAQGRELIARVRDEVGLAWLRSLVLRTGQTVIDWAPPVSVVQRSMAWSSEDATTAEPLALTPDEAIPLVVVDPLRGPGDPVLRGRNVTTQVIRELARSGDSVDGVAEADDLTRSQVEAALADELGRRRAA